ncbi:NAD(P)/FAD-dependent oxidoreductase [Mesorhizobium caraganae]|uniref:NAD(P)/FAD-dependent oxidoreductase n=1 Tax=Mesorhizobium caraganae TaxID=483206 RepID=UPI001785DF5D|nr:NAD(P)/FAD-dependent oxidoreductase [Mesorhizobium caraganae]
MSRDYDAIVVGARCAGASTAMLLARAGLRVLLVDRSAFPSEIAHGHFIHRHGPGRLKKWGLLDRLLATGCPPSTTFALDTGEVRLVGKDLVHDGVAFGYGPRRSALDWTLVKAAIDAGADFRPSFAVTEYVFDDDRVVGLRGTDRSGGRLHSERASITIGADGRGSQLARTVRAAEYDVVPTLTCWFFSYWSDVPATGLEVYSRHERVIFAFPTNDGLIAIFVAWPICEQSAVQSDIERHFMAAIDLAPELAARVRAGRRAERFRGAANLPNFLRTPGGPGWALVGDAGCHKDPYLALGVCDAFRDAELLAIAVEDGLSGKRPLASGLLEYERRRNEATSPEYQLNLRRARFEPPTEDELSAQRGLVGNQDATNRFFMASEGMIQQEAPIPLHGCREHNAPSSLRSIRDQWRRSWSLEL